MTEIEELRAEIADWRENGAVLWKYVRPWGLCGGHPEAINAAAELARLLGIKAENQIDANVELLTRKKTIAEVIEFFESDFFRKMRRSDAESFVAELKSL